MHQDNTAPRWGDFKALQARFPGAFARTKAYELLAQGKLRAKKFGGRTLWDFASVEALIEGSPDFGKAA
ncbi:MAG: hypothetical protein KGJ57_04975 [Sphingomonadales bacterium]|nr:hypothetical protein [Sphingomonadales bacterium]MDE2168769.1 hypothetical protein [Sphingomonadales bacterium]